MNLYAFTDPTQYDMVRGQAWKNVCLQSGWPADLSVSFCSVERFSGWSFAIRDRDSPIDRIVRCRSNYRRMIALLSGEWTE
jgi:hypothetical protein